jgi:hypothetical protein
MGRRQGKYSLSFTNQEEQNGMTSDKVVKPKVRVKRPSKGFRLYIRRQKQAARKASGMQPEREPGRRS